MKSLKIFGLILLFLTVAQSSFAQTGQFNLNGFRQFIQSHQNMTSQQLMQMHNAGIFQHALNISTNNILYYDTICSKYNLTQYEKQLVQRYGFMVTERLKFQSFGEALKDVFHKDLPVYVSTDAILHSLHMSYDAILVEVEGQVLIPKLKLLLQELYTKLPTLNSTYWSNVKMRESLQDLDVYITVARKLVGETVSPYYTTNTARIDTILGLINDYGFTQYSFFGEPINSPTRYIDFSQFKPRGHYTDPQNLFRYPLLEKYFKAMIWLSRIEIFLIPPSAAGPLTSTTKTMRTVILSALLLEAAKSGTGISKLQEIETIIKNFVGEQDNVTVFNFDMLMNTNSITNPTQFLDTLTLRRFQDTLLTKPFAYQRILSQAIVNAQEIDSIIPASTFMLLGQRFVIDSYVTGSVVYDRIKYYGQYIRRMLPNTLDVLFALGNDASAQLLQNELNQYNYATNLAADRYVINSLNTSYWYSTLFNNWLHSIMKLNPPSNRNNLPATMQTAAYWQQKMNTQLGSWTQLRHDNLLYAKQSYTGIPVCSFPYGYVEPFPEFYNTIEVFSQKVKQVIHPVPFENPNIKNEIIQYCNTLKGVSDTLKTISEKELNSIPLTQQEGSFLQSMLRYVNDPYYSYYTGWYYKLFFKPSNLENFTKKDYIVADIHTSPADEVGNIVGWVKHVGMGPINLGVFVIEYPVNQSVAYVGPFFSYYDYTTENYLRLTDQEWAANYLYLAARPSWVNMYLADSLGSPKPNGPSLIVDAEDNFGNLVQPKEFILYQNYPNPFNSSTLIKFTIPDNLTNSEVELNVYDITGSLVKRLIKQQFQSGNYIVRWEGISSEGNTVPSGIYFYQLKVEGKSFIGKMNLIK
jgi:hypothetical protein